MAGLVLDLGNPVDTTYPLNRGRVVWWLPMPNNSGGGKLWDIVFGNRCTGTLTGGVTWATRPGTRRSVTHYNSGSSQYADAGNPPVLNLFAMTIAIVVRQTDMSSVRTIVGKSNAAADLRNFEIDTTSGNTNLRFYFTSGSGNFIGFTAGTAPTFGAWNHYHATYDGVTQRIYTNGVADGTNATTATPDTGGTQSVSLGRLGAYTGGQYWDGDVASVSISNRAWSAAEVAQDVENHKRGVFNLSNGPLRVFTRKSFSAGVSTPATNPPPIPFFPFAYGGY